MDTLAPVLVNALFPAERAALLALLEALSPEQWSLPTICPGWSVHDIALHLLGDDIGFIARRRDRFYPTPPPPHGDLAQWEPLVALINEQNATWVRALRRTSPPLLCQLLKVTGDAFAGTLAQLDLMALGGPVSWAGPDPAPIWLDSAREYTERWIHQQQIRDAVGQPGLQDQRYLAPVIATLVHALPHTLRNTVAAEGTTLRLVITGDAGGTWTTVVHAGRWRFTTELVREPTAEVTLTAERAWRLFTKGLTPAEAALAVTIVGDQALGRMVLALVAIIA